MAAPIGPEADLTATTGSRRMNGIDRILFGKLINGVVPWVDHCVLPSVVNRVRANFWLLHSLSTDPVVRLGNPSGQTNFLLYSSNGKRSSFSTSVIHSAYHEPKIFGIRHIFVPVLGSDFALLAVVDQQEFDQSEGRRRMDVNKAWDINTSKRGM